MARVMIAVSDQFLAALRAPHNIAIQATLTPTDGSGPIDLPVLDGTVTIDRFADHRRHLDLTISNPLLYPEATTDPLNVYGSMITVSRGIRFANESNELVQLGVFRVEDVSRDLPGGALVVSGWDKSRQVFDERFLVPRKFAAQQAITLIRTLISEVYADAVFDVQTTDSTQLRKHVVDRDRWAEVQRVAHVIGCEVYADEQGVWVIRDTPDPTTATPVWVVDAGVSGVLVSASNSLSRDSVPNEVVALGQTFSGTSGTVTISHAAPATVTQANHGLVGNQQVSFHTGGTLPAPLTQGTTYWVSNVLSPNTFRISTTRAGPGIDTTTDGTGTFTMDVVGLPLHSVARDTNPNSPTYYLGAYGEVPRFYSNTHITTQAQCDRVAAVELSNHLGATRTISFTSIANPALDVGDAVTVAYPDGHSELHIVDEVTIPLSSQNTLTATTRALTWNAA